MIVKIDTPFLLFFRCNSPVWVRLPRECPYRSSTERDPAGTLQAIASTMLQSWGENGKEETRLRHRTPSDGTEEKNEKKQTEFTVYQLCCQQVALLVQVYKTPVNKDRKVRGEIPKKL